MTHQVPSCLPNHKSSANSTSIPLSVPQLLNSTSLPIFAITQFYTFPRSSPLFPFHCALILNSLRLSDTLMAILFTTFLLFLVFLFWYLALLQVISPVCSQTVNEMVVGVCHQGHGQYLVDHEGYGSEESSRVHRLLILDPSLISYFKSSASSSAGHSLRGVSLEGGTFRIQLLCVVYVGVSVYVSLPLCRAWWAGVVKTDPHNKSEVPGLKRGVVSWSWFQIVYTFSIIKDHLVSLLSIKNYFVTRLSCAPRRFLNAPSVSSFSCSHQISPYLVQPLNSFWSRKKETHLLTLDPISCLSPLERYFTCNKVTLDHSPFKPPTLSQLQ